MIQFVEKKRTALFALPIYFTTYTITEDMLNIKEGFFKITENDCYMYKIQDVTLTMTLIERIFKLSTITCHTGDTTNPIIVLKHIKNGRAIKEFLLQASDEARLKRRTINTVNIGADDIEEDLADE
ncbi:MAG: PH domain-containing protein [Tyzzerella sp.]|nr:PH domain-containing protein [Tyzzerella sp.]